MRAECAFDRLARHFLWASPTLRSAQYDHGPLWALVETAITRFSLNCTNLSRYAVQRCSHQLMHRFGVVTFDEIRPVPVADKQTLQFILADASQQGGVRDLVAVQMQDRQHRSITRRVQKLVRVPACRQWSGLGLTVAYYTTG